VRGSTCSWNSIPDPLGRGSMRSPTVAEKGFDSAWRRSVASPVRSGRSTWSAVVPPKVTSMP
jgi:hypothetical protein